MITHPQRETIREAAELICSAFYFGDASEGFDFWWTRVYERLLQIAHDGELRPAPEPVEPVYDGPV